MSRDFGLQEMHSVNFEPDPAQWVEVLSARASNA